MYRSTAIVQAAGSDPRGGSTQAGVYELLSAHVDFDAGRTAVECEDTNFADPKPREQLAPAPPVVYICYLHLRCIA